MHRVCRARRYRKTSSAGEPPLRLRSSSSFREVPTSRVTGSFVRCTTLVATEPITSLPMAPMPLVPITMPSQLSSSALLTIIGAVSPTRTSLVNDAPAFSAASIAGRRISSPCFHLDARSVITVTFLTLAFAQLWHVFNMRHPESGLLRNEVTRNPWVWGALLLCTALLAVPAYLPPMAHLLHLTRPDLTMWAVILGMSLAPALVGQAAGILLRRRQSGSR